MRRTLNLRFLLVLLGSLGVVALTCHVVHTHQVRRNAGILLEQALEAEASGKLQQAAAYLGSYVAFVPGDTDALAHYGHLLGKLTHSTAARQKAIGVLEQVLRREPARCETRWALVRLALDLGRQTDARPHLELLLRDTPDSAELTRLLASCEELRGEAGRAAELLQRAIAREPSHVDSHVQLARLLGTRLDDPAAADEVMDQLIASQEINPAAYLARARWHRQLGRMAEAGRDLARARQLAPNNATVQLTFADWASIHGDVAECEAILRQVLQEAPRDAGLYLALARLALQQGKSAQALRELAAGLQVLPGHVELLLLQTQVLIQEQDFRAAAAGIKLLDKEHINPELRRFLEAQLLLGQGRAREAAGILKPLLTQLKNSPELAFQVALALGWCYLQQEDAEESLAAYQHAAALAPRAGAAHTGMGMARFAAGQLDAALDDCRHAVKLPGAPAASWVEFARVLVARNARLPEAQRDWSEAEAALQTAERHYPGGVDAALLRATILHARNETPAAVSLLLELTTLHPRDTAPWTALAALSQQRGETTRVLELLDKAERQLGPSLALSRARLRYWAAQEVRAALPALNALEHASTALSPHERTTFAQDLAEVRFRHGDLVGAMRLARERATALPADLPSRLLLVDLYLHMGNSQALEQVVAELRLLEEGGGTWWRYAEAARLATASAHPAAVDQARQLLAELARLRPDWARVPLLDAYLDERQGNLPQAVSNYQRAVDRGEQRPRILQRLVFLLNEFGRFGEADQVLRRMENTSGFTREVHRLAAEVALALRDNDRAAALARRLVPEGTTDYREQIWLAGILHAAKNSAEAEQVLRRQLEQSPRNPELWLTLVGQLASNRQTDQAGALLPIMRQRLPAEQVSLTLARCHALLGQRQEAAEHFAQALRDRPDDFLVLFPLAEFWLRLGDFAAAEPHLRKLGTPAVQAPASQAAWARRQLALGLAARPDAAAFQEAIVLLDLNASTQGLTLEDLRARARVLATRSEHQAAALQLLQATQLRSALSPADQLLLAKLLEAARDLPRAREVLLQLVSSDHSDPHFLVEYIRVLRRWGEEEEARVWTNTLRRVAPHLLGQL